MQATSTRIPTTGDRVRIDLSRCASPQYHVAKTEMSEHVVDISSDDEARSSYAEKVAEAWTLVRGPLDGLIDHLSAVEADLETRQNRLYVIAQNALGVLRALRTDLFLVPDLFRIYGALALADANDAAYEQARLAQESYILAGNAMVVFLARLTPEERRRIVHQPAFVMTLDWEWSAVQMAMDAASVAVASRAWTRPNVVVALDRWEHGREGMVLGRTDDRPGPIPSSTLPAIEAPAEGAHVYRLAIYEEARPGYAPNLVQTDSQFSADELAVVE